MSRIKTVPHTRVVNGERKFVLPEDFLEIISGVMINTKADLKLPKILKSKISSGYELRYFILISITLMV
jgi:hypothetical protein